MRLNFSKFSALALLSCLQLAAQIREAECSDTPPDHALDQNGAILPQYREWDPGRCSPAIPERRLPGTISVPALNHKVSKGARREFETGVQALRKGRRQEAIDRMERAARLDGRLVEARIVLGALHAGDGQPELALEYFNSALSVDPNSALSHAARAGALVFLNRPEEAEGAARRALQIDPRSVPAHYQFGH